MNLQLKIKKTINEKTLKLKNRYMGKIINLNIDYRQRKNGNYIAKIIAQSSGENLYLTHESSSLTDSVISVFKKFDRKMAKAKHSHSRKISHKV